MASVANCLALASAKDMIVGRRFPSMKMKALTVKYKKIARIIKPNTPGLHLNFRAEYLGRGHLLAKILPP